MALIMPRKGPYVSGSNGVNVLRILFYTFLFLLGLLWVLNLTAKRRSDFNDKVEQYKQNEARSISYRWQSYLWSSPWNEAVAEQNQCNFEDYVLRQRVHQTDPCLIATVKNKIILPPPPPNELNTTKLTTKDELASNIEKYKWIEKLLIEDKSNTERDSRWPGFFIDCGANDGKFISPTIRLERNYNWTGLLVEANPTPFEKLKKLKRNAWAANVASCTTEYPDQLTFYTDPADKSVGTAGLKPRPVHTTNLTVQCIPMYTMLKALEVSTVDFLSLDVEGFELAILKTIPFDKVRFKVMAIEYNHIPGTQEALRKFLEPKGYRFVKEIHDYLTEDCLYVHESLYDRAKKIKF